MQNLFRALIAALLLCQGGFSSPAFGFGLAVSPTTVEMSVKPAKPRRQSIRVANVNPGKSLRLSVGVADWSLDARSNLKLMQPGSLPRSAAGWLRFSPANLTLAPGESREILVDISPPAKLPGAGDFRAALLISTLLPPRDERQQNSGIWSRQQVAALFYLTTGRAASEARLESAYYTLAENDTVILHLGFSNAGNSHARLEGRVNILNQANKLALSKEFTGVVLNGQRGEFSIRIDPANLPGGNYRTELEMVNIHAPQSGGRAKVPVNIPLPGFHLQ